MFLRLKRLAGSVSRVKWDLVAVLLFVPLASQSINRYLGNEPFIRRLGSLREPLIEMALLTGIGIFICVREAQRLRTMERLRAAEARYRGVVEDQTELNCRFLPDWTLTFVNDAYCRYIGKSTSDLIGRSFISFVPHEDRQRVTDCMATLCATTPFLTIEHQVIANEELRWQQWTNRAVFDAAGKLCEFQAVGRDITERKQSEYERERLIETLRETNADLEMLNQTISHDLKSPLITVRGLLARAERDANAGNVERLKHNLRVISSAAARMENITGQLSEFLRVGHLNEAKEDLDLGSLAYEVLECMSETIATKGVAVKVASNMPTVRGNRSLILQILQNLIENSIKYMGDQSQPEISIEARFEQYEAIVCVSDNGIGIDPSCKEDVFRLFHRLNTNGIEGCGLGLALVKRAVEVQGGRIWVESEGPGRGSTFCFFLPGIKS